MAFAIKAITMRQGMADLFIEYISKFIKCTQNIKITELIIIYYNIVLLRFVMEVNFSLQYYYGSLRSVISGYFKSSWLIYFTYFNKLPVTIPYYFILKALQIITVLLHPLF